MRELLFGVAGIPKPQGSKVAGVNPHTGKAFMRESSDGLGPWRQAVAAAALTAAARQGPVRPITVPVRVAVTFHMERPKRHYRTGRFRHLLREDAPEFPTALHHGDVDKLMRAVGDALSQPTDKRHPLLMVLADTIRESSASQDKRWCGAWTPDRTSAGATVHMTVMPGYEEAPHA